MVLDSWFLEVKTFFNFHSLKSYSAPSSSGLLYNLISFDVEELRWFQKQAEKQIEKCIAVDNFCEVFSVICLNTSTVASFEKSFIDLLIKFNNRLLWCETWNSVG